MFGSLVAGAARLTTTSSIAGDACIAASFTSLADPAASGALFYGMAAKYFFQRIRCQTMGRVQADRLLLDGAP